MAELLPTTFMGFSHDKEIILRLLAKTTKITSRLNNANSAIHSTSCPFSSAVYPTRPTCPTFPTFTQYPRCLTNSTIYGGAIAYNLYRL